MPCSRLLMFRNFRRVSDLIVTSPKPSYQEPRNYGDITRVGLGLPQYRFYTDYILPARRNNTLLLFNKAKSNNFESGHAQLALKRLFERFTFSGSGLRPVGKFAKAVGLFITRPNFLLPSTFAITSGKLAWQQKSVAELLKCRLLMFRNFRRVSDLIVTSPKPSYQEPRNYGDITRVGLGLPQYRFYTDYILPARRNNTLLLFNKAKSNNFESGHAQLALKRLFERFTFSGSGLRPVGKFAKAVGLFITRPNFLLPSTFAITSGKLAWQQKSVAELLKCRLLMFRNFRRVSDLIVTSPKPSYQEPRNYGDITRVGLGLPQYRFYTDYILPARRNNTLLLFNKAKSNNFESGHAQLALKRLFERFTFSGSGLRPVGKFAKAVGLFITRPNFLLPSTFAITSGKLAWQQKSVAETEQSQNTVYIHAQDGHAFMTSVLLSALEGVILLLRALYLGILFSPSLIMMPFFAYCGPEFRRMWLFVVHRTLEKAGPAFIKWGQWAATRPDLFPRDLCIKLSELHMKAPEHSFAYTKKTIEGAFGRKIPEIFENFEEEPIASGSIAQVHRATLRFRYPNQVVKPMTVAVKVRHPGVSESIRRDFVIINSVAKLSMFIPTLKWWRLDESVQQFSVFMMSQVDLAREASHLSRFLYNFRHHKDVSFPKPLYPLVHPAVLVETYEQGECVSNYLDELPGQDQIKAAVAHSGTKAYLKMLLVDNYIHADMHPGNILVRVPQRKSFWKKHFKLKPHVIFLDVGMTAELSRTDQVNLVGLFKAIARRDGRTAAECTLRLSNKQKCPNPEAFIEEMEKAFIFWGSPEGDLIHPAECMHQVLEKVRRHRVNVDGNVCTVMVTTLVLEGWQRKLDPAYNVMQTLQMYAGYQNSQVEWAESLSYTIQALMAP